MANIKRMVDDRTETKEFPWGTVSIVRYDEDLAKAVWTTPHATVTFDFHGSTSGFVTSPDRIAAVWEQVEAVASLLQAHHEVKADCEAEIAPLAVKRNEAVHAMFEAVDAIERVVEGAMVTVTHQDGTVEGPYPLQGFIEANEDGLSEGELAELRDIVVGQTVPIAVHAGWSEVQRTQ